MRNHSNLKTCYYVRYAERLKYKAKRYLHDILKLELSEEKTLITNVCSNPIKFLGGEIRMAKKNGMWVNRVSPEKER